MLKKQGKPNVQEQLGQLKKHSYLFVLVKFHYIFYMSDQLFYDL